MDLVSGLSGSSDSGRRDERAFLIAAHDGVRTDFDFSIVGRRDRTHASQFGAGEGELSLIKGASFR